MNKVFPTDSSESNISKQLTDSIMAHNLITTNNYPNAPGLSSSDINQTQEPIVKPTKDTIHSKDDNPRQMSTFVKFLKTSLSSNKKKPDVNMAIGRKSIGTLKSNVSENNQPENINVDISIPGFLRSTDLNNDLSCRFCQEAEPEIELVSPCLCSGTMKYIHQSCLQRWIKTQDNRFCELCKYEFHMKITTKPLKEWQKMEMSVIERRKVICSVTFHVIALTCVIWSLYVLIERTAEEMRDGRLEWPFWTKLIVIAIGFVGGIVFMYVQCRMYWSLCRKLHAFNRTFAVQSISSAERKSARQKAKVKLGNFVETIEVPNVVCGDVNQYFVQVVVPSNVNISEHLTPGQIGPAQSPYVARDDFMEIHNGVH